MSAEEEDLLLIAHRKHSIRHRAEVMASERCGCFYCLSVFPPSQITEWTDHQDGVGTTALCPKCGIDAVIGSASGLPLDATFLKRMSQRWFS